ncbi:MAG: amidohydrolase family protein [Pseudomonadota bacterium]
MSQISFVAPPDPEPRTPKAPIPAGACDCHFHVFDGPSPQIAERSYSAPSAPLSAYRVLQAALDLDRAVIVQPSIFGTDNRTTMQSMPTDGSVKAIVVFNDQTRLSDLQAMSAQGAVGARLNMLFSSGIRAENLTKLASVLADIGWHLQILTDVSAQPDLMQRVTDLPVPVVFDHMGHVPTVRGVNDPGFQALLRAVECGTVWVKLSGAYRITKSSSLDYDDVAPMAKALISANPDRLVWGSDWPHPAFDGPMPNDGDLLDLLFDWAGPETARKILVENPERLYRFPKWEVQNGS